MSVTIDFLCESTASNFDRPPTGLPPCFRQRCTRSAPNSSTRDDMLCVEENSQERARGEVSAIPRGSVSSRAFSGVAGGHGWTPQHSLVLAGSLLQRQSVKEWTSCSHCGNR
eukprot:6211902-Prymnesium_polylepis.2